MMMMVVSLAILDGHDEFARSLFPEDLGMLPEHVLLWLRHPSLDQYILGILGGIRG